MTSQKIVLDVMRAQGTADALDLRARASELDGTALIAEEAKVPKFDGSKDYSSWESGAPVWEEIDGERQIFTLITPHNASHYPGSTPSNTPALWSIRHTKDPKQAKPWLAPNGTSGRYALDECATENGHVYRNNHENNEFSPSAQPERWTDLGTIEDVQQIALVE